MKEERVEFGLNVKLPTTDRTKSTLSLVRRRARDQLLLEFQVELELQEAADKVGEEEEEVIAMLAEGEGKLQ